jgi:hypothetical protein
MRLDLFILLWPIASTQLPVAFLMANPLPAR